MTVLRKRILYVLLASLALCAGLWPASAQQGGQITVTGCMPNQITRGQGGALSVYGSNFTAATTVALSGVGTLPTNFVDSGTLTAQLPTTLTAGTYDIEVADPVGGTAMLLSALTVVDVPTETPTATPPPPVSVTRSEPTVVISGQSGALSIYGANFTAATTVRLVGLGLLQTTFINSSTLTAALPSTLPVGQFQIEVSDPVGGAAMSPNPLRVQAPPPPPTATREPQPTPAPPTPVPGQPLLLVRNFTANPATIPPGGTVQFTIEVVNRGTRVAQGISAALDAGSRFVPASGQASVMLPDLAIDAFFVASLTVVAGEDAPAGPINVPVVLAYRDFEGKTYTSKADLSVTVAGSDRAPQVTLSTYTVNPDPAKAGEPASVTATVENSGNETASQVLVRVTGTDSVLLAGSKGDTFSLGDLGPGESAAVEMPLVVRADAKSGPQPQLITITYIQKGELQQVSDSLTVNVVSVGEPAPLILLTAYDAGADALRPGDRFTLSATLQNMGDADATELLVTFGTVETSSGGDTGGGGQTGSQTNTRPSTTFAPLGTGGRLFVGVLRAAGGEADVSQDFIVDSSVKSGVYSLPITLRYQGADNKPVQETLYASLLVVSPPRLLISLQSPVPETVNAGEPFPLALDIVNTGETSVNLKSARVEAENAEVVEGAETTLNALKKDEDTTVSALVMPLAEGPVNVTVTLHYLDDLNREQTIVNTYSSQAMPPPVIEVIPTPETGVPETPEPSQDDLIQRLLLGLLGLGS